METMFMFFSYNGTSAWKIFVNIAFLLWHSVSKCDTTTRHKKVAIHIQISSFCGGPEVVKNVALYANDSLLYCMFPTRLHVGGKEKYGLRSGIKWRTLVYITYLRPHQDDNMCSRGDMTLALDLDPESYFQIFGDSGSGSYKKWNRNTPSREGLGRVEY